MSDEWKPCPFCGEQIEVDDLRDESFIHPFNEDCPLSNLIVWRQGKTAWNTRAPVSVQEAAKVLLGDDEACLRLAEAYDREDGAQRGDPSPHVLDRDEPDYAEWAQDRVGCAKAALRAIAEGGEA